MTQGDRILIVDDEPAFLRLCSEWLEGLGYGVKTASDPDQAASTWKEQAFDLVLLDLALPPSRQPEEGLRLIPLFGATPVIVLTGHAERELALRAIEQGAWDFLNKPVDPDLLRVVVSRALTKQALEEELRTLRAQVSSDSLGLLGRSRAMETLRDLIRRIAPSDLNVMILGPSGTGKELVARAVHRLSPRHEKPFVPVHCGAIPATLLESELFGALRGSYTGADRDRLGVLETADGGVLFLDEIGEMPSAMQVKLLRFLQEGTFTPVGGHKPKQADVRIICASHRDVEAMVREGAFREDVFYRLKGIILRTPALRERPEDVPILAQALLQRLGRGKAKRSGPEVLQWLLEQPWSGNVRELGHLLECAVALAGDRDSITLQDVQLAMGEPRSKEADHPTAPHPPSLDQQVDALEKRLIVEALEATGHNQFQAAQRLGISRSGLLKKMRRLGLR